MTTYGFNQQFGTNGLGGGGGGGFGGGFVGPITSVPTSGLLLYLDAGNSNSYPGSGNTWFDLASTPTANNATLVNTPTYSSTNGGHFNFAAASSESATVSGTGLVPSSAYTKAVWFRLTDTTSDNNLVSSATGGHFMFFAGTNKLYCGHANVFPYDANPTTTSFVAGAWYLAVATYTSSEGMKVYVNGALDKSFSITAHTGDGSTNIGRFSVGNFLNGDVAQVLTYDRAISAAEVASVYSASKSRYGL